MAAPDTPSNGRIVVIGASAGGVEALRHLVALLPGGFGLPIFVVLHVPPTNSFLPQILQRAGTLPARHAQDGDPIEAGKIVIAPPDFHLLIGEREVHLSHGPRENGHRPAVDPLFRTAVASHGSDVVGVVLSGSQDDGAIGLANVKLGRGITVAQEPAEALYPAMPQSAIDAAQPDHVLPLRKIAGLLMSLDDHSAPDPQQSRREANSMHADPTELPPEAVTQENRAQGEVTPFTCPECGGTLWEIKDSEVVKLRCRVGHSYTEDSYGYEKEVSLEAALWTSVTALVEKADFSRRLARRLRAAGHEISAERYEREAENSLRQSELVRQAVLSLKPAPPLEEAEAS